VDAQTLLLGRHLFRCETDFSLGEARDALRSLDKLYRRRHGNFFAAYHVDIKQPTRGVTGGFDVSVTRAWGGDFGFWGKLIQSTDGCLLEGRIGPELRSTLFFYLIPIWFPLLFAAFSLSADEPMSLAHLEQLYREFFVLNLFLVLGFWVIVIHGIPMFFRAPLLGILRALLQPKPQSVTTSVGRATNTASSRRRRRRLRKSRK